MQTGHEDASPCTCQARHELASLADELLNNSSLQVVHASASQIKAADQLPCFRFFRSPAVVHFVEESEPLLKAAIYQVVKDAALGITSAAFCAQPALDADRPRDLIYRNLGFDIARNGSSAPA